MSELEKMTDIVKNSKYLVAFTGAGVSTESGIPDFRSKGGTFDILSRKYGRSPEEILSIDFFEEHPDISYIIHRETFLKTKAFPNKCHKAFAELEKMGILKAVVTQNIDNLHQDAGSKTVLELHGNVYRNVCSVCRKEFDREYISDKSVAVPKCDKCGGVIRQDIVLYGEPLDSYVISEAIRHIESADTLVVAGTSLRVYPAAGFIDYFNGKNLVLINRDETPYDYKANLIVREKVGEFLDKVMKNIKNI